MLTRSFLALALASSSLCVAGQALGALQVDPGDSRLTLDTNTGLVWLDLTETTGLSYDDILADVGGWRSAGFRYATAAEVCNLFNTYLILTLDPCPRSTIVSGAGNQLPLIGNYLGVTRPDVPYLRGLYDDGTGGPDVGEANITYNVQFNNTPTYVINDKTSSNSSDPYVGHFLIQGVGAPDPGRSSLPDPPFINVVGTHAGAGGPEPDPAGQFAVIVRDALDNPLQSVPVTIDFSACTDVVLCDFATPGETVNCAARTVTATTDAAGLATFNVVGAANDHGVDPTGHAWPGCDFGQIEVRAGSVLLGNLTAAVLDLDGTYATNGLNALDLAYFSAGAGAAGLYGDYRGRYDYNFDETISALDLAVYSDHLGRAALNTGSGAGCPAAYCP